VQATDAEDPTTAPRISGLLDDAVVLRAIARIEADYSASLTLATIADAAGLSAFHFHRRFHSVMGETVAGYVRRVRVEHAATHVCRTQTPLVDLTFRFGYGSQEAFTRTYVQRFSVTPGRMRRACQEALRQPLSRDLDWAGLVRPQRLAALPLLGLRFFGNAGACWRSLAAILQQAGFPLERARGVGVLYDDPGLVSIDAMRFDCCIVDEGFPAHLIRPPLRHFHTHPGLYATLTRDGGSDTIAAAISSIVLGWLPASRHTLGDPTAYEFHLDPPWDGEGKRATVWVPLL
jgi:AraC family transcriptional regulator